MQYRLPPERVASCSPWSAQSSISTWFKSCNQSEFGQKLWSRRTCCCERFATIDMSQRKTAGLCGWCLCSGHLPSALSYSPSHISFSYNSCSTRWRTEYDFPETSACCARLVVPDNCFCRKIHMDGNGVNQALPDYLWMWRRLRFLGKRFRVNWPAVKVA